LPPAGGIEPGSPQGAKCQVPRAAEATSGATARPLDLPLSITARYNSSSTEYPAIAIENETETFSVGLRLSFGAETLRDRDRTTPYDGHYGSRQSLRDF
jgi:hypothetical protein